MFFRAGECSCDRARVDGSFDRSSCREFGF